MHAKTRAAMLVLLIAVLLPAIAALRAAEPRASGDSPQWGGTSLRNNAPEATNIPLEWNVGGFDRKTGAWKKEKAQNIKWQTEIGSCTMSTPVVAGGRVYVGANNRSGYVKRYPSEIDVGTLLCFREEDGKFLWQFSAERLPGGLVNDWPLYGMFGSPLVEGDRVWQVTNRCEVVCLDVAGFHDGEDDGPIVAEQISVVFAPARLHNGLDDEWFDAALELFLAQAKCNLPRERHIHAVEEGKRWLLGNGLDDLFEVRLEGVQLVVYELNPDRPDAEPVRRAARRDRLIDDVSANDIGPLLRDLFTRAGYELPKELELQHDKPAGVWSGKCRANGVEREFRLRESGKNLVAETILVPQDKHEADVIWRFDMLKELNVHPHNWSACSVTTWGDVLFVCTSNGVDESHNHVPHPEAPSFLALDKRTGKVLWTDNSPGEFIYHTRWSSPAVGILGDVPQVLFGGGDGWLYSFRADRWKDGKPELLWKFDGNPKESLLILEAKGTRNEIVAMPVIYDGLVYLAMGQDPEHGEAPGDLWCIDPTKRGDVSPTLAVAADGRTPLPRNRIQVVDPKKGELAIPNPNSASVWHYRQFDQNGDGKYDHKEVMHRSRGSVTIRDNLLLITDFSGIVHCLNAKTGAVNWSHDMLAASWGSPLIVDGKIYVADEDGDMEVFGLSARREEAFAKKSDGSGPFRPLADINMQNTVFTTPVVANGVLFIATKHHLFAIGK